MSGPKIYFEIPILGGIMVTETMVNMLIAVIFLSVMSIWLGSNLSKRPGKRQIIAEKMVTVLYDLVEQSMGAKKVRTWAPYIGTLFCLSIVSSLLSLFGLRPPTADFNVTFGWALLTFVMIQGTKIKRNGIGGYFKGFADPMWPLTPINIMSELSTPVSMGFRHFGNILSGVIISTLIYQGLGSITASFTSIPFMQIGIPAVASLYFDLFSSFMQAFIFIMLTMVFVAMADE